MRKLFFFLLLLPFVANAQLAALTDTSPKKSRKINVEGFAQAGYMHELWVVSSNLTGGYSSLTYAGKGAYIGAGFTTKAGRHKLGFGLSADYLGYVMDSALLVNELTQRKYAFARFTPAIQLHIKTHSDFTFHWSATGSMYVPMHARENNYYQLGLKACVGYNAFVLELGYAVSNSKTTPSTLLVTDHWRDQAFSAGLLCYPSRFADWGKVKAKIKHEFKH